MKAPLLAPFGTVHGVATFATPHPTLLVRWALTLYVWCDHAVYCCNLSGAYARFFHRVNACLYWTLR